MKIAKRIRDLDDQSGATIVIIVGLTVMFVAFTALSIDIAHLYVVRNELQNAADAGALAGARYLYNPEGSAINTEANQVAYRAATANNSDRLQAEVNDPNSNTGDVQRGHWSFATQTFTPNGSIVPTELWNITSAELDADPDFINAVRVRTSRVDTQAASFFARILGFDGFNVSAEAVAYIGFAGEIAPGEADQPIAICRQSIADPNTGEYTCNTGRMLNSGSDNATHNTAGWTNFSQPCEVATTVQMRSLVCSGGNLDKLKIGTGVGSTGGVQDITLREMRDCFEPTTRTEPWNMTLPVIDCPENNVTTCSTVVGAVNISIVWISRNDVNMVGEEPTALEIQKMEEDFQNENFPPSAMADWTCDAVCESSPTPRACCWDNFVEHFNLKNVDGITATYAKKSIYFLPDCSAHELTGRTGGVNYGVLAKIPVLVN